MKKMLFAALCLAALALSARPISAAPSEIVVVDRSEWERFDQRLGVTMGFNMEIDDSNSVTHFPESASWLGRERWTDSYETCNNCGKSFPADISRLTKERLARVIPEKWSGAVTVEVRHAISLPADNASVTEMGGNKIDFPDVVKFEHPLMAPPIGTWDNDVIEFAWERSIYDRELKKDVYIVPDEDLRYTDTPDMIIALDGAGNVHAAERIFGRGIVYDYIPHRPLHYGYQAIYSFLNGTVVFKKEDFPLDLYFVKLSTTQYEISVSADASMGNVTPEGPLKVNHGEDASFTITAKDGCRIAAVIADGERKSAANPFVSEYSFKNVTSNHSLEVLFADASDLPEVSAAPGVTATVADYSDSRGEEAEALERGGFVSGDAAVKIAGDGTEMKEGTFCADENGYVCTVKLSKECTEGAGSGALTLTVKPKVGEKFAVGRSYYALVLNAKTNYYDVFPAKLNGAGHLEATLKPVRDYAALSTVFVYSGTASPGKEPPTPDTPGGGAGPKSSGGCNAGLGAIALLALAPLALRRKK